jgi:hypothetical protein
MKNQAKLLFVIPVAISATSYYTESVYEGITCGFVTDSSKPITQTGNRFGTCITGYDANNIASNYYYVGPSAFTFDENEEFVQCYKYFLFGPNTKADEYPPTYGEKVLPQGVWKIYKNIQGSSSYTTYELIASNTSSNINIIPTLNWSPSLTITTP